MYVRIVVARQHGGHTGTHSVLSISYSRDLEPLGTGALGDLVVNLVKKSM